MNCFTAISFMISNLFLVTFIYLFIVHRYSRRITGGICFFLFLSLCVLDCFKLLLFPDSRLCYVVATILQIILTQSVAFFTSSGKNGQTLFVCLSASSYVIAGTISAIVIHICTGSVILALLGSTAMHLAILAFLLANIRETCLNFQKKAYGKSDWELCLIPIFFYCSFSFTGFFPYTLYDNPHNIPGILFIVITMFVSYIVVLRYLETETKKSAVYWQNMLQESYIQGLENRHYLVQRAEQNLKILHHDIRHYSNMINSLLAQKKYEEIKEVNAYISHIANENTVEEYCSNLISNSILSNMMAKAMSLQIQVDLETRVPKEIPVNDYELALVIANLFENAVQCVKTFEKGQRYIEMKIHCQEDQLFIQTKNKYEGEILLDPVTKLPRSKKSGNHGLGMQSILAFSKKINGTIGCYLDDGIFHMMMYAKF